MQNEITFSVGNYSITTYTATLWNKIAGKERYYVKTKSGKESGFLDIASGEFVTKSAWGTPTQKDVFMEAFNAALAEANPVEAAEIVVETEVPAVVAATIDISNTDGLRAGQIVRNPANLEQVLKVLKVGKNYIAEDGYCFGLNAESGTFFHATCRVATETEIAALIEREVIEYAKAREYRDAMNAVGAAYSD